MLNPIVVVALIALFKALAEQYLPGFPISEELINSVVVFLLGLFGLYAVQAFARRYLPGLFKRGLLKD